MSQCEDKKRPARNRARQRRGYAMLLVMMIILTSSAFVALHQRNLNAALRVEQARIRSEVYQAGPVSVLAVACQRLEVSEPSPPVSYQYSHTESSGTVLYRIDYSLNGTQWTVTAKPDATATTLPVLPGKF